MKKDRFDIRDCKVTMKAVVTTGNGGYEKLDYRDVPIPKLGPDEVLLQVLAAGINNTEINTRLGWYSSKVTTSTESLATGEKEKQNAKKQGDGGWNEATPFPFIQGTDCCGRVVAAAPGVEENLMGLRVLVRSCIRSIGWDSLENIWMASDFDGAFAQFVKVPATEVFPVNCDWNDAELGTIPCAYGTALVSYIEKNEIKPLLAKSFPLKKIIEAQQEFTEKKHVGKFVLIPPPVDNLNQSLSK